MGAPTRLLENSTLGHECMMLPFKAHEMTLLSFVKTFGFGPPCSEQGPQSRSGIALSIPIDPVSSISYSPNSMLASKGHI